MSEETDQPYGDGLDARRGQTTETRPASIVEALARHAERTPHKLCLLFEEEEWSYGRLRERAETFSAALRTWGLRPGDRVALFLGNHPDFLGAYLGTHLARGVIVPVNTQYRKAERGGLR
jgi:acyl-CoA synthetase (AMP-forming)/AMP-acid ligase II